MASIPIEQFDYHLPPSLIAQRPADSRSASRLMRLDRKGGRVDHCSFISFPDLLRRGDILVLNDTEVFPARLVARRHSGGAIEVFLLSFPVKNEEVPCLVRPARRVGAQDRLFLEDGSILILRRQKDGFTVSGEGLDLIEVVKKFGQVPLPPYIRRKDGGPDEADRERYQTVYASRPGAVAAPTAGLHFDDGILSVIEEKGVPIGKVTLHVGPGTFLPVRDRDITAHNMQEERYTVPSDTADLIRAAKGRGGRVVAVGTTVVRALESAFDGQSIRSGEGKSRLFIYPGYRFSVVDALLTNFHLPRSTLLMLVCAFGGNDLVMNAYREAVKKGYRFYSYGDAMFIE